VHRSCSTAEAAAPESAAAPTINRWQSAFGPTLVEHAAEFGELGAHLWASAIEPFLAALGPLRVGQIAAAIPAAPFPSRVGVPSALALAGFHSVDHFVEALALLCRWESKELVHPLLGELLPAMTVGIAELVALFFREAFHALTKIVPLRAAFGFGQIAICKHLFLHLLHFGDNRIGAAKEAQQPGGSEDTQDDSTSKNQLTCVHIYLSQIVP
jgi:hypothetical protein